MEASHLVATCDQNRLPRKMLGLREIPVANLAVSRSRDRDYGVGMTDRMVWFTANKQGKPT
jgi:hypothetical protein